MRRVGIVGAGQLARMMAQAAIPLDITIVVLADSPNDAAAQVVPGVEVGTPGDVDAMRRLAARTDVITFDHELVDIDILAALESDGYRVAPSSATMAIAQNKREQRERLSAAGLPNPRFVATDDVDAALTFADSVGWPLVVKAARGGYDGRGVFIAQSPDEARAIFADLNARSVPILVEETLDLEGEVAVLVARNGRGEVVVYPPVETVQRNGICNELRIPALLPEGLLHDAEQYAREIADVIDMVGIMAIEFFIVAGRLLINELAPRPHNSGHWTIDGAVTSQFEQHLRAVLDLPLGDPSLRCAAVCTVNILGREKSADPRDSLPAGIGLPGVHVHLYGKEPRPGRKIGHVTVVGDDRDDVFERAWAGVDALLAAGKES